MKIWKQTFTLEALNHTSENTLAGHLQIVFCEAGDNFLRARMPVSAHTVQPMRILHGGASVALAETIGSMASMLCVEDLSKQQPVGLEINANHLRSVSEGGMITATCHPVQLGRNIHVWQIDIHDDQGRQCCTSRLTMMIKQLS